jgi:hypothetical protein
MDRNISGSNVLMDLLNASQGPQYMPETKIKRNILINSHVFRIIRLKIPTTKTPVNISRVEVHHEDFWNHLYLSSLSDLEARGWCIQWRKRGA